MKKIFILITTIFFLYGCNADKYNDKNYEYEKIEQQKEEEIVSINKLIEKTSINKNELNAILSSIYGFPTSEIYSINKNYEKLMFLFIEYMNTPYKWGGKNKKGIDCSAFIQTIFWKSLQIELPRTSLSQSEMGEFVEKDSLKFGDLVFFDTRRKGRVTHVGMYLGNGYFAHSGSKTGVSVADLNSEFYKKTYLKAKRFF